MKLVLYKRNTGVEIKSVEINNEDVLKKVLASILPHTESHDIQTAIVEDEKDNNKEALRISNELLQFIIDYNDKRIRAQKDNCTCCNEPKVHYHNSESCKR